MNVTCDKCGKKYFIPDEKVAGKKSVKIRCKQCQNLIPIGLPSTQAAVAAPSAKAAPKISAAPSLGTANPWDDERTRAMPALDLGETWYAMIQGKQTGPFNIVTLQGKVCEEEVTLRTYLWKPGMNDWKRASEVPEVSPLFAGLSVGATAVGPTQPAAGASVRSTHSDVAVANEVFSPQPVPQSAIRPTEIAPAHQPKSAKAQVEVEIPGAEERIGERPAEARVADAPQLEDPQSQGQQAPAPDEGAEALGTVSQGADQTDAALQSITEESAVSPSDPFAAISGPSDAAAPPGETTRFFMARAGVNRRNPPWKIALFVMAFIGLPISLVYLLNTLHIVDLPKVTRTTDDGREIQEPFFSPGGMSGLKDMLTGDAKRKQEEARRKQQVARELKLAQAKALLPPKPPEGQAQPAPAPPEVVTAPKPSDPIVAAFYRSDERKTVGPRVRPQPVEEEEAPAVNSTGLSREAISKVVGDKSKAFGLCIDNALHRNPNLAVGDVTVQLVVGSSGAVKSASINPPKYEGADWAQCMMSAAKRIVFPASDGETNVELPFKVGVAVVP